MKKTAFLFPGQGSQKVGMGLDLCEISEFAGETFDRADRALSFPLSRLCFEGPEDQLKLTQYTQPALLTVSYILFSLLGRQPDLAAGHSLGEYSALVCAGALDFEDAVKLVHQRGLYMQEAVPVGQGAMAALIGADIEKVRSVAAAVDGVVDLANWNSAAQLVISGEKTAVEEAARQINAAKTVFLPVSAPFHSRLMLPAEEKLALDLAAVKFQDLKFPIRGNVGAELTADGEAAREGLKLQVSRPVLWHSTMERMLQQDGVTRFVEIGPGNVLAGLLKKTARELGVEAEIESLSSAADLQRLKQA